VSVEDDESSGQPSTSKMTENVEIIWELIHKDHRWTIHDLADTIGIRYEVCQEILTENLNMCHIATKFVPRLLTNDQKQRSVNMCLELREKANGDLTFISRVITGDESLIYGYDPETKQQLSQWRSAQSPRAKKARQVRSSTKSMLIAFFLTWRGLFTMNLFLLTLQSTLTFTVMFWYAWGKMCDKRGRNFGASTTGSFIMTCPPTRPWKPQSLWLTTGLSFSILPTRRT
jgi:hypothetical protein